MMTPKTSKFVEELALIVSESQTNLQAFLADPERFLSTRYPDIDDSVKVECLAIARDLTVFGEMRCRQALSHTSEEKFVARTGIARRRFVVQAASLFLAAPLSALLSAEYGRGSDKLECIDQLGPVVDVNAEDAGCGNDAACVDNADCRDTGCVNEGDCRDGGGLGHECVDDSCTNTGNCGDQAICRDELCSNSSACSDDACFDRKCYNDTGCSDTGMCVDYETCTNAHSCVDNDCYDNVDCSDADGNCVDESECYL